MKKSLQIQTKPPVLGSVIGGGVGQKSERQKEPKNVLGGGIRVNTKSVAVFQGGHKPKSYKKGRKKKTKEFSEDGARP